MTNAGPPDAADAGFTLLEVVVALGICGLAIGAIAPVVVNASMQARRAEQRLDISLAAQQALSLLPPREQMRPGSFTGALGNIDWLATVEPLAIGARDFKWRPYRVSIRLKGPQGVEGFVETIRLGRDP